MRHYDLRYEPWIIAKRSGEPDKRIGIEEALINAHLYDEYEATTGLQYDTYAVYRLLITIILDIYKPKHAGKIAALYHKGQFDPEKIREYLDLYVWDLYDENKPFMQYVPCKGEDALEEKEDEVIAFLTPIFQSGNEALFPMRTPRVPKSKENERPEQRNPFRPDEAAATLLRAHFAYASTGRSAISSATTNATKAAVVILANGKNVFETIVLGLPTPENAVFDENTRPFWARDHYALTKRDNTSSFLCMAFYPVMYIKLGEMRGDGMIYTYKWQGIKRHPEDDVLSDIYKTEKKDEADKTAAERCTKQANAAEPHMIQIKIKKKDGSERLACVATPGVDEAWYKIVDDIKNITGHHSTFITRECQILEAIGEDNVIKSHELFGLMYTGQNTRKKQCRYRIAFKDAFIRNRQLQEYTAEYVGYIEKYAKVLNEIIRSEHQVIKQKGCAISDSAVKEFYERAQKMYDELLQKVQKVEINGRWELTLQEMIESERAKLFAVCLGSYKQTPMRAQNRLTRQEMIEKFLSKGKKPIKKKKEETGDEESKN